MNTQMKKQKPGKVIRVDPMIWKSLEAKRKPTETISATLRRLLGLPPRRGVYIQPQTLFVLPESRVVCQTLAEARGEAILRAIRKGLKKPTERPIEVRVVGE